MRRRWPGAGRRRFGAGLILAAALSAQPDTAAAQARPALRPDSLGRLVVIATDNSGRASLEARAAALHALNGQCADGPVAALVALGRPYLEPWVIWRGALAALSACARPALAPLWRELLGFPRRPVRELAIVGLARTGVGADRPALAEATHRETDPHLRRLAAWADSMLARPAASRDAPAPRP